MKDLSPTAAAEEAFWDASRWFKQGSARSGGYNANPAEFATLSGLVSLTEGLTKLAVGMRATYILLEDVERQLAHTNRKIDRLAGG